MQPSKSTNTPQPLPTEVNPSAHSRLWIARGVKAEQLVPEELDFFTVFEGDQGKEVKAAIGGQGPYRIQFGEGMSGVPQELILVEPPKNERQEFEEFLDFSVPEIQVTPSQSTASPKEISYAMALQKEVAKTSFESAPPRGTFQVEFNCGNNRISVSTAEVEGDHGLHIVSIQFDDGPRIKFALERRQLDTLEGDVELPPELASGGSQAITTVRSVQPEDLPGLSAETASKWIEKQAKTSVPLNVCEAGKEFNLSESDRSFIQDYPGALVGVLVADRPAASPKVSVKNEPNEPLFPVALIDGLVGGHVVPFVGSGVSISVKKGLFPSWKGLLEKLADRLHGEKSTPAATVVRSYISMDELLKAADQAVESLHPHFFRDEMLNLFGVSRPADVDLALPKALWSLSPKLVVTTNYDCVLQWSNVDARPATNHQTANLQALFRSKGERPIVWHLHGHIDDPDSLILSPQQYRPLYDSREEGAQRFGVARQQLTSLIAQHPLLFVGFGLQDEYVMDALRKVLSLFGGNLHPHYALLKSNDENWNRLWKDHGIHVVPYTDHGAPLVELLEKLKTEVEKRKNQLAAT